MNAKLKQVLAEEAPELYRALCCVSALQSPSVAKLLEGAGYRYESDWIKLLVEEFKKVEF